MYTKVLCSEVGSTEIWSRVRVCGGGEPCVEEEDMFHSNLPDAAVVVEVI